MKQSDRSQSTGQEPRRPRRKEIKHVRRLLKHGRKWLWVQRDILAGHEVQAAEQALARLQTALEKQSWHALPSAVSEVERQFETLKPRQRFAGLRENLEAIFVALVIAGAVRTYFVQPFKIPTGSMEPTLYGIHPSQQRPPIPYETGAKPGALSRFWGALIWGKMYYSDGYRLTGDRIFVDRFTCNFSRPSRGQVIVFRTRNMPESYRRHGADFYIKRLVGLGDEKIQVLDGKLYADDRLVESPPVFKKIYNSPDYSGYCTVNEVGIGSRHDVVLYTSDQFYKVPKHGLFVFGDNSKNSTDSRYWGEFPRGDVIGTAFLIYWPLVRIRPIE